MHSMSPCGNTSLYEALLSTANEPIANSAVGRLGHFVRHCINSMIDMERVVCVFRGMNFILTACLVLLAILLVFQKFEVFPQLVIA